MTRRLFFPEVAKAGQDSSRASECPLQRHCPAHLAPAPRRLSPAIAWGREPAGTRRGRARLQPSLELRPLADRDAVVAEAVAALHGEVGALLVAAEARGQWRRRVSG